MALLGDDLRLPRRVESALLGVETVVIGPALMSVAQDVIRLVDLGEPGVCVGRCRDVRVAFAREAAIGEFDFSGRCAGSKSKDCVEVLHGQKLFFTSKGALANSGVSP